MYKNAVILSENPDSELIDKFRTYLYRNFSGIRVEVKSYKDSGDIRESLVLAEKSFPISSFDEKIRSLENLSDKENAVFILSEGLTNSPRDYSWVKGVIYRTKRDGLNFFGLTSEFNIISANQLLRKTLERVLAD